MRSLFLPLIIALALCSCKDVPTTKTIINKEAERSAPEDFLKVNFEVHRNLMTKKVVEGTVLNTGKFLTYKSVTLKIISVKEGNETPTDFTISETLPPGGKASFKYKPEGNPESVKVAIASAIVE